MENLNTETKKNSYIICDYEDKIVNIGHDEMMAIVILESLGEKVTEYLKRKGINDDVTRFKSYKIIRIREKIISQLLWKGAQLQMRAMSKGIEDNE